MAKIARDMRKEAIGWISIMVVMLVFPALFFLCVYIPLWLGWAPRWGL